MRYLLLLPLFTIGCATTHKLSLKSYPAKPTNCKLDIFITKKPNKEFEEIAFLKGTSLDFIKKRACLDGGDGLNFRENASIVLIKYTEQEKNFKQKISLYIMNLLIYL